MDQEHTAAEIPDQVDGPIVTVMGDGWDRYRAKPWMQRWSET